MPSKPTSKTTPPTLTPLSAWLTAGLAYVHQHWQMLLRVYLFSMAVYLGFSILLVGVPALVIGALAPALGLTWNATTITLTVLAGIGGLIMLLLIAGKMTLIQLRAIQAPITHITKIWSAISWREAWHVYTLILLSALTFYGGLALLFIPGVIVGIWISLALFVYLEDGVTGLNALIRSRDHVRGHWWAVFGRLALATLLMLISTGLLASAQVSLAEINGLLGIIAYIFYIALTGLLGSVFYRLNYTLYLDLKKVQGKLKSDYSSSRRWRWRMLALWPVVGGVVVVILLIIFSLI